MELQRKIEYAINLIDNSDPLIFEELFKLVSLCKEIQELKSLDNMPMSETEVEFMGKIIKFYKKNGQFRSEVNRFTLAKQLISQEK
ncbi:hypothetical protein ACG1BZ_17250 [Microbulbifer sp. CNSA002]|uniref:hypothetical protein n=1 Tax=Microbulbifer sp. CNSA002 TaxID=3373604 RepID=UPI0039B6ACE2